MFTEMTGKRRYVQRRRAQAQDETRTRIVEAAMQLHEEIGPRATTISAIAARAGVQRLTVYRHFADEAAVFRACTSHWLALHPPPDPQRWTGLGNGHERFRAALLALYAYYRATERMWAAAYRDEPDVPALQGPMRDFRAYLDATAEGILGGLDARKGREKEAAATVTHAVQFPTWASLAAQGLDDEAAASLATSWLRAACGEATSS